MDQESYIDRRMREMLESVSERHAKERAMQVPEKPELKPSPLNPLRFAIRGIATLIGVTGFLLYALILALVPVVVVVILILAAIKILRS